MNAHLAIRPAAVLLCGALLVSCAATVDPLAALTACAPAGWSAAPFPPGSRDFALRDGQIRLITPASVAARPRSTPTLTFITDWWTVTDHAATSITFADGRTATQYRSRSGKPQSTTELALPSGTWQLYAVSEEQYDVVLRCLEPRLAGPP